MGYFKNAVKGFTWIIALQGSTRVMSLVKVVLVARLIGPEEFGSYTIAALILALLEVISETGINIFLIQEEKSINKYISTAWVISIVRGFFIAIGILFLAEPITEFFNSKATIKVLYLTSLIPIVKGFVNPAIISFQKDLKFNKEFNFRTVIYMFDIFVALFAAQITRSAESLIYGMWSAALIEVILSWAIIKPRPKFEFDLSKIKIILQRGKWLTATSIINYFFTQGDDIIVGRLLSSVNLGFYQMAYKIGILPITEIHSTMAKVTLPIYTKIRGDINRLKKAYYKVVGLSTMFSFAFVVFIYVFSDWLIMTILGNDWIIISPVIKVLSVFGLIRTFSGSISVLLISLKKQKYITFITLSGLAGELLIIYPLVINKGILGASYAVVFGASIELLLALFYLYKVFYQSVKTYK